MEDIKKIEEEVLETKNGVDTLTQQLKAISYNLDSRLLKRKKQDKYIYSIVIILLILNSISLLWR